MSQLLGHSTVKYVTGTARDSSVARRWSNILAERWSHTKGELPPLTPRETEVAILLRGTGLVDRVGSGLRQTTHARHGTIWLCPAGIREEFIHISEPLDDILHVYLPGRPFEEMVLRDLDLDPDRVELRYEVVAQDLFIAHIADLILKELSSESSSGRLLVETLGLALSAHLVHNYSSVAPRPALQCSDKPLNRKRLDRVVAFVRSNLDADLTVSQMATVACVSPAHFARSFRAATGMRPYEFVRSERLACAKQRLLSDEVQIGEIASAAGFSSPANFTRAFRNAVGTSPALFRARKGVI